MELLITEKYSVAECIARVIGADKRKKGYLEGNRYLISWCAGHLLEPAAPEVYRPSLGKWAYESLPVLPDIWRYEVKAKTISQYKVLCQLMRREDVSAVICACDAGREGELIFRLVYEQAGCKKGIKRLWISSMEETAIKEGMQHLKPGSEYDNLYRAALCRQKADWLVGINGTRLFTVLYGGRVLKVGRVQTPTLAMLVKREGDILNFKKEKYYVVHILVDGMDAVSGHMEDKKKAEEMAGACRNGQALVTSVQREEKTAAPPKLYDLTTLQRDANRLFGFTAKQTLDYVQNLYEKKLARTDSQYLSDDMRQTTKNVIKAISQTILHEENGTWHPDIKRVLNSRKVTDHHAIIPTMELVKADFKALPEAEFNILSLIAYRLLCATGESCHYESIKAELSCNGYVFTVSGKSVIQNGWKSFEDFFYRSFRNNEKEDGKGESEEKKLPDLTEGQTLDRVQAEISEHFTSAPKRFTEDSLLSAMERAGSEDMGDEVERKGLGTPATRADIIEKLVKDGFVKREGKQMIPTEDGLKLIEVLPDTVKSPALTVEWENELVKVEQGLEAAEVFMEKVENMVKALIRTYHEAEEDKKDIFVRTRKILGICPNCRGEIVKGKYGAYCSRKCGMNVARYYSVAFTDSQIESLLSGKRILLKGIRGKEGKPYDLYLKPTGVEKYSYVKDGKDIMGCQFTYEKSYPDEK